MHTTLKTKNTNPKSDFSYQVLRMEYGKSVLTRIAVIFLGWGEKTSEKIIFFDVL